MAPEWLSSDGLSSDADLRKLQLRWFRDEIWMRRAAFCFALIVPSGILVLVVLRPSPVLLAGAGLTGLMALPLIYFFGKGDTVRQPRAIVPSVELENEPGTDTRAAGATS